MSGYPEATARPYEFFPAQCEWEEFESDLDLDAAEEAAFYARVELEMSVEDTIHGAHVRAFFANWRANFVGPDCDIPF